MKIKYTCFINKDEKELSKLCSFDSDTVILKDDLFELHNISRFIEFDDSYDEQRAWIFEYEYVYRVILREIIPLRINLYLDFRKSNRLHKFFFNEVKKADFKGIDHFGMKELLIKCGLLKNIT